MKVRKSGALLRLECDPKERKFWVGIKEGLDGFSAVSGSFDGPLTIQYGHPSAPSFQAIPANPDIRRLAELMADGG